MRSSKHLVKEIMAYFLYKTGILSTLIPKKNGSPIILYYHRICDQGEEFFTVPDLTVSKNNFEKQMEFIREKFNVLPLDVIVERLKKGKALSYRDIAITFDDGYIDNYIYAYPILKKYGIPATIFLTTEYIGSNRLFWWDKLALILRKMEGKEMDWQTFPSDIFTGELKILLDRTISQGSLTPLTDYLKSIGTKKREEVIRCLEENMTHNVCQNTPLSRLFLTWEEIKEMGENGITFGSHSHSHPVLIEIADKDVVRELGFSKKLIRENTGTEVKAFSYPDGCLNDRVKKQVIEAGYHWAVQTGRSKRKDTLDIYSIPRKMVKEGHSKGYFNEFSKALFTMEIYGMGNYLFFRDPRKKNPYGQCNSYGKMSSSKLCR